MGAHAFLKFIRARGHVWKKAPKQQPSMKASNRGSQSPPVMAGAALGCPGSPAFEGELCTRERRLLSVLCSALVLSSKRFNRGCSCCESQPAGATGCFGLAITSALSYRVACKVSKTAGDALYYTLKA